VVLTLEPMANESQPETSIQAKPTVAETVDIGSHQSLQEGNQAPPRRNWGATVALCLILLTFFVFLSQVVIELIVGLTR
jgi:hypothetical protein